MPLDEIKDLRQKAQLTSNEKGVVAYENAKRQGGNSEEKLTILDY